MSEQSLVLSHSLLEHVLTCERAGWHRLHRTPKEVVQPDITGAGTDAHREWQSYISQRLPKFRNNDIVYLHGAEIELRLTAAIPGVEAEFTGVVDAVLPGLMVDAKNAGDGIVKAVHTRQMERYYWLISRCRPDLLNDAGGITAEVFFLQRTPARQLIAELSPHSLEEIEARLIADCKAALALKDKQETKCTTRADWLCGFCDWPISCAERGGISQEFAGVLQGNEDAISQALDKMKRLGSAYDALRRTLMHYAAAHDGVIVTSDGRRWGRKVARSMVVDSQQLFALGCRCRDQACAPWVRLCYNPSTDAIKRLAKNSAVMREFLVKHGYTEGEISDIMSAITSTAHYEDGRETWDWIKE